MMKVSVIMSVYNGADHVSNALSGMLRQTYADFEFLIFDDGSEDSTSEILASVRDSRIRLFRHDRVGLTRSLMRGMGLAGGEYIARLDADDVPREDRLEKQVAFLDSHPEVALVGSGVTLVDEDGRVIRDWIYPQAHDPLVAELKRLTNPLPHSTVMFRKKEVELCGGYRETFAKAQDYDLLLRVIEHHRIASIQEPLCSLRYLLNSFTFSDGKGQQFRFAVLAFVVSIIRVRTGVDPLNRPSRQDFLDRFRAWYRKSSYPDMFRSRVLRRSARLAWAGGRKASAIRDLAWAAWMDPMWPARRLGPGAMTGEAAEALQWACDVSEETS